MPLIATLALLFVDYFILVRHAPQAAVPAQFGCASALHAAITNMQPKNLGIWHEALGRVRGHEQWQTRIKCWGRGLRGWKKAARQAEGAGRRLA